MMRLSRLILMCPREINFMKKQLLIWFVLALILELTVFNYRTWMTMGSTPVSAELTETKGFEDEGDGWYRCTSKKSHLLTFTFSKTKVRSLELRFQSGDDDILTVELLAQDEANSIPFSLGSRALTDTERSHYLTPHLSGTSGEIQINPDLAVDDRIFVGTLTVNARIPFSFQPLRVLLIGGVLFFLSQLFRRDTVGGLYVEMRPKAVVATASMVTFFAVFAFLLSASQPNRYSNQSHHHQYQLLARAFTEGKLYIDDTPNEVLESMDNPYDTALRKQLLKEAGSSCRWDTAYYNGTYYVYFGVIPVLMFYLPWYLLTGTDLLNPYAIAVTALLWAVGSFLLWDEIVKKWFRKLSWLAAMTLFIFFLVGSFGLILSDCATFYVLPALLGMAFGVFGLYFWLSSIDETNGTRRIQSGRLVAGSFCMACIAGCRPQLIVIAFSGLVLFWPELQFWKKQTKFRVYTAAFLPIAAVAAGLMWYNAARFGSPFDFGANYNLTTNDMTKRGIVPARTALGLYAYLFQPVRLSARFPFLQAVTLNDNTYYGCTIRETMYGGALMLNPFLWLSMLSLRMKKWFEKKTIWQICVILCIGSAAIAVLDAQAAGILYRYIGDFAWLLALAACLTAASVWQRLTDSTGCAYRQAEPAAGSEGGSKTPAVHPDLYGAFLHVLGFLFVFQLVFLLLQLFRGDSGSEIMYVFAFWM